MLAAVAIPKYQNLKENAEFSNLTKILSDIQSSVPSAYLNAVDLDGKNPANLKLNQIIEIKGKGWSLSESQNQYGYVSNGNHLLSIIFESTNRRLFTVMYCNNFPSDYIKNKCKNTFKVNAEGLSKQRIDF